MEEINKSKCTKCQEIKNRIQNGKQPDGINKRWVDENGKSWNGRRCPECTISGMKVRMKELRFDRKKDSDV
jgi:type II secretory ATPase GspE/PulE/Tfp pilus assembly ATPase PilB-like protein